MPTIQAAPAQTYPVGETVVPSQPNQQTFNQRVVNVASAVVPYPAFTDPNTQVTIAVDFMLSDGSWTTYYSDTLVGRATPQVDRSGNPITSFDIHADWGVAGMQVKGARLHVIVADAPGHPGAAQPVPLGAISLTWN